MSKIVYYVACSVDGFISGKDDDISGFIAEGNGVQKYLDDLTDFETVIMGRKTYEVGYKFGLKPGAAPYPHMNHYIFSNSLILDNAERNVKVRQPDLLEIEEIKRGAKTDVYLCGGGIFAAWLLENERIDALKLKINPLILGEGTRIFADSTKTFRLNLVNSERYEDGLIINSYEINY